MAYVVVTVDAFRTLTYHLLYYIRCQLFWYEEEKGEEDVRQEENLGTAPSLLLLLLVIV